MEAALLMLGFAVAVGALVIAVVIQLEPKRAAPGYVELWDLA